MLGKALPNSGELEIDGAALAISDASAVKHF